MRRLLPLLLAALMLSTTAACGDGGSSDSPDAADTGNAIKGLSVSGAFGKEPRVSVKPSVSVDKPETEVIAKGTGNPVVANKRAMVNIYLAKGADGKQLFSSVDQGSPSQLAMKETDIFKVVIDGLVGKPRGSRVAIASPVKALWGAAGAPQMNLKPKDTVLFVIDVLSVEPTEVIDGPEGKKMPVPATAPRVKESGGKVTGFDFSKAPKKAPTTLKVIPLIEGDGPPAKAGRLVTFNYYGAVWGSSKPFDSSFSKGRPVPFGVGVNGLIPAWDKVIPGLKRGSRVLIVAPPKEAYGAQARPGIPANSTLTFVVDVLGVDA